MAHARSHKAQGLLSLRLHRSAIWVCVVHVQNVQNVHVQSLEHSDEGRSGLRNVGMSVNRLKRCEFCQAGPAGPRRLICAGRSTGEQRHRKVENNESASENTSDSEVQFRVNTESRSEEFLSYHSLDSRTTH